MRFPLEKTLKWLGIALLAVKLAFLILVICFTDNFIVFFAQHSDSLQLIIEQHPEDEALKPGEPVTGNLLTPATLLIADHFPDAYWATVWGNSYSWDYFIKRTRHGWKVFDIGGIII